jgi:hypothetical protein
MRWLCRIQTISSFRRGYHGGFNAGFNCAEAVNFATLRWVEYGKNARRCTCLPDPTEIDMGPFIRKYQPEIYSVWISQVEELEERDDEPPFHLKNPELICPKGGHIKKRTGLFWPKYWYRYYYFYIL